MCKRILALLLALTLCASLSACGGKQEEEAQPGGHELDEYFGWWQYDDYTSVIAFADGNAWSIYAGDGSLSYTGLFEFDGSGIRALDEQGETAHYFLLDETGTLLTDDDGDTLRPTQAPSAAKSPLDEEDVTLADYVGVWEYDTAYAWLAIDGDGNWMTVDGNGEIAETGTVEEADANGLSLYLPSEEAYWTFTRISATEISEDSSGESLFAVDEIALPGVETTDGEPAFEAAGLTDFCPVDGGSYLLRDGLACFPEDESWYETGDVYWEVALHNNFVHDGIRELEFTAICYIPQESLPDDGGKGYYNTLFCELYDYDSGMWLTSVSATGDSGRDENHFLHTIDWNGSEETIEFFFSNEWGDEGDWGRVLYRSYIAYVPEDYDGLVVGAAAAPLDTDELHVRNQLFETSPYCTVSQMDSIDPYTSLYFRLS